MIISTALTRRISDWRHRAFSLPEVMVAAVLGAMLMAAVLSVVVLQAKLSASLGNYADMNANSRQALSLMERELRATSIVETLEKESVGVRIINKFDPATMLTDSYQVTYRYDSAAKKLYRVEAGATTTVLTDVEGLVFLYFNKNDVLTTNKQEVKKILISATLRRSVLGIANSDYLVSAMVTMRNRIVTS